jgi:hypothetical protein
VNILFKLEFLNKHKFTSTNLLSCLVKTSLTIIYFVMDERRVFAIVNVLHLNEMLLEMEVLESRCLIRSFFEVLLKMLTRVVVVDGGSGCVGKEKRGGGLLSVCVASILPQWRQYNLYSLISSWGVKCVEVKSLYKMCIQFYCDRSELAVHGVCGECAFKFDEVMNRSVDLGGEPFSLKSEENSCSHQSDVHLLATHYTLTTLLFTLKKKLEAKNRDQEISGSFNDNVEDKVVKEDGEKKEELEGEGNEEGERESCDEILNHQIDESSFLPSFVCLERPDCKNQFITLFPSLSSPYPTQYANLFFPQSTTQLHSSHTSTHSVHPTPQPQLQPQSLPINSETLPSKKRKRFQNFFSSSLSNSSQISSSQQSPPKPPLISPSSPPLLPTLSSPKWQSHLEPLRSFLTQISIDHTIPNPSDFPPFPAPLLSNPDDFAEACASLNFTNVSDALFCAFCHFILREELAHHNAMAYIRIILLPHILALTQPISRHLFATLTEFTTRYQDPVLYGLLLPLLTSPHSQTPQRELCVKMIQSLSDEAAHDLCRTLLRHCNETNTQWTATTIQGLKSLLEKKFEMNDVEVRMCVSEFHHNFPHHRDDVKFVSVLHSIVTKYPTGILSHKEELISDLGMSKAYLAKITIKALEKIV